MGVNIFELAERPIILIILPLNLGVLRIHIHSENHPLETQQHDEVQLLPAIDQVNYGVSVVHGSLFARVERYGAGDVVDVFVMLDDPPHTLLRSTCLTEYLTIVLPQN